MAEPQGLSRGCGNLSAGLGDTPLRGKGGGVDITDETTATWALRILGDFALLRDGEVVRRFGSRREDELLAYLALDAGVPKRRDAIAEAMWPQADRDKARKHLSFSIFMLKKRFAALGLSQGFHSIGHSGLILDGRIAVDAQVFSTAIAAAAGTLNEQERLEQALSLYGGPLLPTCDAPWLVQHRRQFAGIYELAVGRVSERIGAGSMHDALFQQVSPSAWSRGGAGFVFPAPPIDVPKAPDEDLLELAIEAEEGLVGEDSAKWIERIRSEYPRIEAFLTRVGASKRPQRALAVASRIWRYWYLTRQIETGTNWLEQLIGEEAGGSRVDQARAYHALGTLLAVDGQPKVGAMYLERALVLWQEVDNPTQLLRTLISLGMAYHHRHETERAADYYDQGIAIARVLSDLRQLNGALHNRATLAQSMEQYTVALNLNQERLALLPHDATVDRAKALTGIACALQGLGEYASAEGRAAEALTLIADLDHPRLKVLCLQVLGGAANHAHEYEKAAKLYHQAYEEARLTRQLRFVGTSMGYMALTMRRQGDGEAARSTFEEAMHLIVAAGSAGEAERFQREWDSMDEGAPESPLI